MLKNWIVLLTASLVPVIAAGCSSTGDGDLCEDGRCDTDPPDSEIEATVCDGVIVDKSGKGFQRVAGRLNDPFAKAALRQGTTCPTTFQEIMEKLRETDKAGCEGDERAGMTTRLVSETAQVEDKPTSYRAVTTRRCGGRSSADGIIFSLFGIRAGDSQLPSEVEVIAFDETAGVFNYYKANEGRIQFFGNSKDMLKGPGNGGERACAKCHPAGGLVMKELDTPWVHWEGHMNTPGAEDLVKAHKDLGTKASGAELESLVKSANAKWNRTRLATLKASEGKVKTADLLKPLFCDVDLNLDNGADFSTTNLSQIPFDSLLDPQLKGFGSISVKFEDYDALIKQNGQRVPGTTNAIDTVFDYVYVERAHADNDYINQLKAAGIVDDDFIKDVLMVDFTRPVFSTDRCGLLAFVPDLDASELNPAGLKKALSEALAAESPAESSPAATLLKHLGDTADAGTHATRVEAFINACSALGSRPFLANALAITSLNRDEARKHELFEFQQTMPTDNQSVPDGARLSPVDCNVTTSFIP